MSTRNRRALAAPILLLAVAALLGCAQTRQARSVRESGFLGDSYALLKEGPEGGALKAYFNPAAKIASYPKVLLEPTSIWVSDDASTDEEAKQGRLTVANRLHSLLYARLAKDYTMVEQPGPGTMRIALALTSAEQSSPTLDTISTVLPQMLVLGALKTGITGRPPFVGEASGEMKLTDAETGELLAAAVDSRVGRKNLSGITNSWEDADAALVYWAERIGFRLCELRAAKDCVAPEA